MATRPSGRLETSIRIRRPTTAEGRKLNSQIIGFQDLHSRFVMNNPERARRTLAAIKILNARVEIHEVKRPPIVSQIRELEAELAKLHFNPRIRTVAMNRIRKRIEVINGQLANKRAVLSRYDKILTKPIEA